MMCKKKNQDLFIMESKIIIIGKSGSGKDYLKQKFVKRGFKPAIYYTTRPMREGEHDGKEYFFIQRTEFEELIKNKDLKEWNEFNGWFYGLETREFMQSDVFIMPPEGLAQLSKEDRKKTLVIYLDIADHVRKERLIDRTDVSDLERRMSADAESFEGFDNYDIRITDSNF